MARCPRTWGMFLAPASLAMTLEVAGQGEEAVEAYTSALEVYPRYLPAVQGLACYTLRVGLKDERLVGWLDMIAV